MGSDRRWFCVPLGKGLSACALALFLLLPCYRATSQSKQAGEIRGTVMDTTGAVVPGVKVSIHNVQTGVDLPTTTDSTGVYEAPFVPPGEYSIMFAREGFKTFVRNGIVLHVETIKVDAVLEAGAVQETVNVTGEVSVVQTENAEKSLVLGTQAVTDIPNVGRSWDELLGLLPGVNGGGDANATGQGIGVNGQTAYQSNWQIDGGIAMLGGSQNPDILQPPLDSIEEVDLSTANFGADRGTGLSVFNVTTKSGTNQFHGGVYEYVENDIFSSHNFFDQPGTPKPAFHWNEYGFNLGGPILKNKLFFFTDFQVNPTSTPSTNFYSYPTDKMRGGDFSQFCQPGFVNGICTDPSGQLYDPATYDPATGTRQPFLGNIISMNRLDPVAGAILSYFPKAQNQNAIANNTSLPVSTPINTKWFDVKIDDDLSPLNRLSGSLGLVRQTTYYGDPNCAINCMTTPQHDVRAQITDVWTITTNKINEFRYSFTHEHFLSTSATLGQGYPAKLKLNNPAADLFPEVSIGGITYTSIGQNAFGIGGESVDAESTFVPSEVFTWIKGKHILKFGGEYQWWQVNSGFPLQQEGTFDFGDYYSFTSNPATGTGGTGLADFFLGLPDQWGANPQPETGARSWSEQNFAQDEYKIRSNLTLTFGLRYVIQSGWREVQNRLSSFEPTILNPATGTLGAIWYAGQAGHTALTNTVYDFFAPRLGFAWSLGDKTSIRGGFGIYNNLSGWGTHSAGNFLAVGWSPFGYLITTDGITPVFQLSQGPPPVTYPTAQTRTPDLLNGQGVNYSVWNTPVSYSEEYQLDIQHQMRGGIMAEIAYVGNRGLHLPYTRDINQVPQVLLGQGQSARAYPQYDAISTAYFDGISNYNALQLTAKKQMRHGLLVNANYAFSKTMDEITNTGFGGGGEGRKEHGGGLQNQFDPRSNYGPSSLNTTHFFNGAVVYEIPVGAGRAFLNRGGVLNAIVGGWEVSSLFQFHSGLPFTPYMNSTGGSGALAGSWRPNRIGKGTVAHPTISEWFDPTAFVVPDPNTFGNSGRNILYGPGYKNVNAALLKNFSIPMRGEQIRLQVKAEASNVFNHPNFGLPDAGIGDSAVGTITSANGGLPARTMQLGAKISF